MAQVHYPKRSIFPKKKVRNYNPISKIFFPQVWLDHTMILY